MNKKLILYGIALGLLALAVKLLEYRLFFLNNTMNLYSGVLALIFTMLGIWAGNKLIKPKKEIVVVEQPTPALTNAVNEAEAQTHGISKREVEVLVLMARGLSNQEIAEQLFVSLNTIKTHSSRLFEKLEVKRRTQAVQKARDLGLIK